MKQEIEELKTGARVFQPSKCAFCDTLLSFPIVHFLCSHSFHTGCIFDTNENNNECPKCAQSIKHPKYLSDQGFNGHNEFFESLQGFFLFFFHFYLFSIFFFKKQTKMIPSFSSPNT